MAAYTDEETRNDLALFEDRKKMLSKNKIEAVVGDALLSQIHDRIIKRKQESERGIFDEPLERRKTLHNFHSVDRVLQEDNDRLYQVRVYAINLMIYWMFFVVNGYILYVLNRERYGVMKTFNIDNKSQLIVFYIMFQALIVSKMIMDIYAICLWANWKVDP